MKRAQSRGDSGFARVLTMLAMLFIAATGAWAQEWISGITNGDFSGDDVSSFCKKEYPSTDVVPVVIGANVGKDGTPGIVVKSGDDTANPNAQNYDTQLWIVLSEEIPAGSTIRVQFDYKASKAVKGSTEYHADPASYLTWQAIGDVNFTTEWKTFSGEFTIPKEADGMKSIAFKLQEEKSATDYYFDNFSVSYKKTQWTNIVANSDMEGTDVSCFYVHEQGKKGIFLPRITEGIGVDGSRAIKVQSSDDEPNSWDTQFFIRLPYVLPPGTMYRLSFDYKADKAGDFGYQVANEPNQYIWWTLDGYPAPGGSFTTEWQHYKKVFNVPADCDGVSKADDNDWLRQFRTIYANLSANKVATEFIFDNVKVEILSNVVSTLTPEPVTDPTLMIPYYDDDDVAVGKLKAAIETYNAIASPTDADKATLKAAIDQYNADNADFEKDETAKVATDGWKDFNGNTAGLSPDWAAPAVTTYDGRTSQPAEVYEEGRNGASRTGTMIYQDITGLTNGQYKVGFYGNAYFTPNRGIESTMEDGSYDVAYVFANEAKKFITARVGESFSSYELLQFDVTVTDGNIKLGMAKERGGSNWHTMQIYQLTWFATAKQAYAAYQTELAALLADAKALAADENKTEGKDAFNAVIATAEEATTTKADWYNNTEIAKIIADLKKAITDFTKANWYIDFAAGQYYIIDAETNLMMAAGHDWGTRAIVSDEGLDLTLTPDAENRTVTIDSRVYNGENSHFLGSNLYMDGTAYGFAFEKQGTGIYILDPVGGKYISIDDNDNLVMSDTPRQFNVVSKADMMTLLKTQMAAATADAPVDATLLLTAPNFNRNDARNTEAWSVVQTLTGDGHNINISGGEDGNGTVGNNCADAYGTPFSFTQTITDAPAGTYRLTAQGFYRQEDYESENPATPQFFANGVEQAVPVWTGSVNSMTEAAQSFSAGKYTIEQPIEFTVGDDGKMEIGVSGTASKQWVCFDNFRLTYLGNTNAPEPATYTVTFAAANANTIEAGKATVKVDDTDATLTDGKLTDVKAGQKVILKAKGNGDYIIRKATVKKTEATAPVTGTIYSWESPAGTVTQTGGTIAYVNGDGDRLNYLNSGYYTICLNGKKNNIGDETASANAGHMVVTLDNALAAGDVISITGYITKNESKQSSAYIVYENGKTAESPAFGDEANIDQTFGGSIQTKTVTVAEEAAGCKNFSMTRGQTGTNLFITKLEIIRGTANN